MTITKDDLKRKRALTGEHFVPCDDDQADRLERAAQELSLSRFGGDAEREAESLAKYEALKAEVRETGLSFRITSVGRKRFEEIVREHQPTEEQKKEDANFNPNTFWPVLFEESVDTELSAAEWVHTVFDSPDWGPGELKEFRDEVWRVNTENRVVELGN